MAVLPGLPVNGSRPLPATRYVCNGDDNKADAATCEPRGRGDDVHKRRLCARYWPGIAVIWALLLGRAVRQDDRRRWLSVHVHVGFAVSAARLGQPDLGLISYAEMADQVRNICAATSIPVIADGDTGYGNALNVERTVTGYAQAGAASVMIEDQVAPKRCGHTKGKLVVDRAEALDRIRAAGTRATTSGETAATS